MTHEATDAEIRIRRVQDTDAADLCAFYNGLSQTSKRTFRPLGIETTVLTCAEILRRNHDHVGEDLDYVAVMPGAVVGWGFVHDLKSLNPYFGLAVADLCQRKGLGARLMDATLRDVRNRGLAQVGLTVVKDNALAYAMYEKRGFVPCGEAVSDDGLAYFRMRLDFTTKDNPA